MKVQHSDIIKIIRDANTMLSVDDVEPEDDLRDLGADSLDLMNILLSVQEKFGVEIPDTELDNLGTVASICAFVNKDA